MRTQEPCSEGHFRDFIESLLSFAGRDSPILEQFAELVRGGSSDAELKRWLGVHIYKFSEGMREQIVIGLAADALHTAAVGVEEQVRADFVRIWKAQGFAIARSWYQHYYAAENGDKR